MIYSKIFSEKYKNYLRVIVFFVLSSFLVTLNSCYTVSEQTVTAQELKVLNDYQIIDAKMKNDSVINLEQYEEAIFTDKQGYSGAGSEILMFTNTDTNITMYKGQKEFRFQKQSIEFPTDSITALKISIKKTDVLMSVLAGTGITIGVILILGMLVRGQMEKGMSSFRFGG